MCVCMLYTSVHVWICSDPSDKNHMGQCPRFCSQVSDSLKVEVSFLREKSKQALTKCFQVLHFTESCPLRKGLTFVFLQKETPRIRVWKVAKVSELLRGGTEDKFKPWPPPTVPIAFPLELKMGGRLASWGSSKGVKCSASMGC